MFFGLTLWHGGKVFIDASKVAYIYEGNPKFNDSPETKCYVCFNSPQDCDLGILETFEEACQAWMKAKSIL